MDGSLIHILSLNVRATCHQALIQEAFYADDCTMVTILKRPTDDDSVILKGMSTVQFHHYQSRSVVSTCTKDQPLTANHHH